MSNSLDDLPQSEVNRLNEGLGLISATASMFDKNDPAVLGKTLDLTEINHFDEDEVTIVTVIERVDTENAEERTREIMNALGFEDEDVKMTR